MGKTVVSIAFFISTMTTMTTMTNTNATNVIINTLAKMIQKNERELDRFVGRNIKAQLIARPNLRMVRAADTQVHWYSEEVEALKLELEAILAAMPIRLRPTENSDTRRIWHWNNRTSLAERGNYWGNQFEKLPHWGCQVKIEDIPLSQLKSLEAWERNFYRWKNDPIYHPISIEVENDQIHVGFILLRSVKSLKENKDSAQSHEEHQGHEEQEGQEGQAGWVDYIVLDESYRGLGYGARALKMAVEYTSKELSLSKLSLWVSTENLAALKCFEKSGFKATALGWDRELRCEKFRMDIDMSVNS